MPPTSSPPLRALVIDDDEMSRELLTVLLEGEGYTVDSAESGEAALTQLSNAPSHVYHVILADMQMPGISGAQLARRLRQTCGSHPLLLAISGSRQPAADIALFDGFLLKPFPMEAIASALLNRSSRFESHQSRTPPSPLIVSSIAASAAQEASNQGMTISVQEQEFNGEQTVESTADHATANGPVLNEQIYRQLAGSMPSPQLKEMYALCINDARKRIAGMRSLVAEYNAAQFVREAHAIKGGSGMLGATELHRMAAALEVDGLSPSQQGKTQNVNSLDELCAACDRLERMLGSRV